MNRNAWISKSHTVEMPWGVETRWSAVSTITGKKLEIHSGLCTSLKFHRQKNEVLFVASGEVTVFFASERHFEDPIQYPASKKILTAGGLLNVQAGCPYRVCANEDSIVYEISDGTSENVVRIEDEYGRAIDTIEEFQFIYPKD
tara:strand:- start:398 stop:829 length:432 start_codon:yes stop_codon:yes gene_type:complete